MSDQEIDDVLDQLEINQLDDNKDDPGYVEDDQPIIDTKPADKPKDKPPGYKTYDEWVADGRDPADYKGENAYKAEYERIKEIRELKSTMSQVVSGMETWQKQQQEQMQRQIEEARAQAQAELVRAREDEDIDAALAAKEKLTQLETQAAQVPQVNPVITKITTQNPLLDKSNPQYDPEFFNDVAAIHDSTIDKLVGGDRTKAGNLTHSQIERSLNYAINEAKKLHPDKFSSPKNQRRAAPPSSSKRSTPTPARDLKSLPGNPLNRFDKSPAQDIYEMLKASDPKAAETFAKNMLGD